MGCLPLAAGLGVDRLLLTPAFIEGGRLTLGGVHYVLRRSN